MAQHLYGSTIRVFGIGTWVRDVSRKWALDGYFVVERFEVLVEETLDDALVRLRAAGTDWAAEENIIETSKSMREGSF
jgi:hypothetical protein